MNLKNLKDAELLVNIQTHVKGERQTLTVILHHLREVEVRKLFSELGYQSLFDYMVNELKYSHGEAGRKMRAVRLLAEIPEIEDKIKSGSISLTHISQVQSFSYQKNKLDPKSVTASDKLDILKKIENTSTRESEKIILELSPDLPLSADRKRQITPTHTEMKFVMNAELASTLEEVRSLLGTKAIYMSFAELIQEMALLSISSLKTKRFGKKRTTDSNPVALGNQESNPVVTNKKRSKISDSKELSCKESSPEASENQGLAPSISGIQKASCRQKKSNEENDEFHPSSAQNLTTGPIEQIALQISPLQKSPPKTLSRKIRYHIWQRDKGKCTRCSSRHHLNIDHIHPKALGGDDSPENLRLLCFHCNQRRSFVTFGIREKGKALLRR